MKKSRFTETQIVAILREGDSGINVTELCRKHSISNATYYKWKSKYGGLDASDLKKLKELESENSELKKMFADLSLENKGLKALIEKKAGATGAAGRSEGTGGRTQVVRYTRVQGSQAVPNVILSAPERLAGA